MSSKYIRKVAVLGAGVMGSGIAAHIAGAGYPVLLLDIVPPFAPPEGTDPKSKAWRNKFGIDAKEKLLKAKPNAYHSKADAELIEIGNLEDDLERLNECQWVIEAVKEDVNVKRALFAKIDSIRHADLVVASNTSGIPIASLLEGRSAGFSSHFFVTHFFNPPRYMRLLEIVAGPNTDKDVLERTVRFGEEVLGKGIVYGKDTPNFVANRIGTFGMLDAIHHMLKEGLSPEEVDALLGTPVGHPKSALFRTGDIVGLDTFAHVAKNCYDLLTTDEERDTFKLPEYIGKMVAAGQLGDKSKGGFYKKGASKKDLSTLDPYTGEYRAQQKARLDITGQAKEIESTAERIKFVVNFDDKYGKFVWTVTARGLAYAARRLGEIADDVVQIDRAMRWGFNWELGPFETWDAIGLADSVARMKKDGIALPKWVDEMLAAGVTSFYRDNGNQFYDPFAKSWKTTQRSARAYKLPPRDDAKKVVEHNDSATLFDIGDGVFLVEFHSKMNSVDPFNTEMLFKGVEKAEKDGVGLVIGNEASDAFSAGANLFLVLMGAQDKDQWPEIEKNVKYFQDATMRLKYANVPTVAAPFGLTLGGGAEVAMGAQAIRAHAELYMGLVELGAGLIPGGGGTKEVLWRLTSNVRDNDDLFPAIQRAFETIAMAKVSFSAAEAKEMGFLTASDRVTFNRDQLIFDAKQTVLAMNLTGFRPQRPRTFRVGGTAAMANLTAGLWSMEQAHQISEHDRKIASKLAFVLTGGPVPANSRVSEQYLLDLEREAFMSLIGEEKTQARMQALLTTGKPLRN
jgi:3-hydroxyacyl-CoA dehydrogenase